MNEFITTIKEFVEGRLAPHEFREILYNEPAYGDLLADEAGQVRYGFHGGTYVFVISQNFDDLVAIGFAQDALSEWLARHNVEHSRDGVANEKYELLLAAQPSWLDIDGEYMGRLLREAGSREGVELKNWLKQELRRRFVSVKRPPKWVQNPAWPIGPNGPLVFLGQLSVGDYFHDAGFAYVFLDPTNGTSETVIQVY